MYTGKEGYRSIAYEVICSAKKSIQSITCGHPGSRNDKHIIRCDAVPMEILETNGWYNSKSWSTNDAHGNTVNTRGVYLICDGGFHRWPNLISPIKVGLPKSNIRRWSAMLESVRKDIECVFGILKSRFRFLKIFPCLDKQKDIDHAFVTSAILYNILLRDDGYLDADLMPLVGGVPEIFAKWYASSKNGDGDYADPICNNVVPSNDSKDPTADGVSRQYEDDTPDEEMETDN